MNTCQGFKMISSNKFNTLSSNLFVQPKVHKFPKGWSKHFLYYFSFFYPLIHSTTAVPVNRLYVGFKPFRRISPRSTAFFTITFLPPFSISVFVAKPIFQFLSLIFQRCRRKLQVLSQLLPRNTTF